MPKTIITVLLFLLQQDIFSQPFTKAPDISIPENLTSSTTGISAYIKEHFSTDTARIRAIFDWVATNINYDIAKFLNKNDKVQPIADVLRTRLAVCVGYADLFNELCSLCNIHSMVISGYTKQKGVVCTVSHAWVAAELDHKWYLFDPTWAAGYVNGNKFTKAYSTKYYKLSPDLMIMDHMPFDPLYEFLETTVSNKEFAQGKPTVDTRRTVFNFIDTLQQFNLLSNEDKVRSELRRIQKNGIENDVIQERVIYLKKLTESFSVSNSFEHAIYLYNYSISLFNDYITYKNKMFNPPIEDKAIKKMLDSISYHANASYTTLSTVIASDEVNRQAITKTFRELEKFQNRVNQEKDFVTAYIGTSKNERERLFSRR